MQMLCIVDFQIIFRFALNSYLPRELDYPIQIEKTERKRD